MNRKTMTILSLIGLSSCALGQDIPLVAAADPALQPAVLTAAPVADPALQPAVLPTPPVAVEDADAELNFGNEEGEFNNEEGAITEEIDVIPEPSILVAPTPDILLAPTAAPIDQPTMRLLQEAAALGIPDILIPVAAEEDQKDNEEAGLEGEFNNEEGVITEEIDIVPEPVAVAQPAEAAVVAQPAMRLLQEVADALIVPVPIVADAPEVATDNEEANLEGEFNNEEGVITEEIEIVPEPVAVVAPAARLLQEVVSELPSIPVLPVAVVDPVAVAEPVADAAVESEWANGEETEFGNEEGDLAGDIDIVVDAAAAPAAATN